ncbi:chaperone protein dnaJ 20, chloroplastic-like [Vigna unguiculata]|uniref:Curved DNA-binding protein n=1 Tax=Vigna unguiculata TaxID=3917 RepID=A0A4D6KGU1_VIGUN|nr:chaperone protein dnaJ 20, chloroplastic-like [Vigna unguiculata]QCD76538.1 curved DNA-binding protein [Vigna unguiculata]
MDVLTIASTLSISKPFQTLSLPNTLQTPRPPQTRFSVSCRATKQQQQVRGVEDNLYKILSLSPNSATTDDIKKAYRSMARQYHPDVCHDSSRKEELTRMFVQLNAAYTTLSNPRLRAEYDYELGLRSRISVGDESWRMRWVEQLAELKRRSHRRTQRNRGSWGTRVRAQTMNSN